MINIEYLLKIFDLPQLTLSLMVPMNWTCWKTFGLSQKLRQRFQLNNQVSKGKLQSSLTHLVKKRLEEEKTACDDCFDVKANDFL
jgi:hypothetical protein